MKEELNFRWLRPDESRIGMAAIDELWRKNHILARDEVLFCWQYERGKHPGHLGFLVAESDGKIVGFSGLLPLPWHYHGSPIAGGVGAITIIAPEYREAAQGLGLMAEVDRDLNIVGSFGINKRVARLYELQGRYVAREFPRRIALADCAEEYLDAYAYPETQKNEILKNCHRLRKKPLLHSYTLEKLTADNLQAWDSAWRSCFAPRLVGVGRPGEYVDWRYLRHPRYEYECLLLRGASKNICGLAVFRVIDLQNGLTALKILDFLALDHDSGHALAAGISEHVPERCAYIEFFAPGRQGDALASIGLDRSGSNLLSVYSSPPDPCHCEILSALLVNLPDFTPKAFAEHEDIYFTIADGDQDRPN